MSNLPPFAILGRELVVIPDGSWAKLVIVNEIGAGLDLCRQFSQRLNKCD